MNNEAYLRVEIVLLLVPDSKPACGCDCGFVLTTLLTYFDNHTGIWYVYVFS